MVAISRNASTNLRRRTPLDIQTYVTDFTRQLANNGFTPLTIDGYTSSIRHFSQWAHIKHLEIERLNTLTLIDFANHRCQCFVGRDGRRVSKKYVHRIGRFISYLEQCGIVEPSIAQRRCSIPEFREWLITHRAVCQTTVDLYEHTILKLLARTRVRTHHLTAASVRALVLEQSERCSIGQVHCIVTALRAYLRFLAAKGRCKPDLDRAIPNLPHWRLSTVPHYLKPTDVEAVIASCDTKTKVGVRDRAILLLLARLGLRAGDIVNLQLTDINWQEASIAVSGKTRIAVRLPLPQDAGDAVLQYLEFVRPRVPIGHLFLCMQAPFRPFTCSPSVSSIVAAAVDRAGVISPTSRGTNLLRHSAATTMLRSGASLQAVSRLLRHRSADMTAHYAKVDIGMLEQVVQPWPGVAQC